MHVGDNCNHAKIRSTAGRDLIQSTELFVDVAAGDGSPPGLLLLRFPVGLPKKEKYNDHGD
jgi:hypothetical protein